MEWKLSKVAQLASCRAGIQTQVCVTPDPIQVPLLPAVGTMHWNLLLDSSRQPHSPRFCLHGLHVCGSWRWWIGGCRGPYGFLASDASNMKQPSLSAFFLFPWRFCLDWMWALTVGTTLCHYSWWGRGQFWTSGKGLINDQPKPEFRNTAWGLPNFSEPAS